MRWTKLASSAAPRRRVHHLGVELHAVETARIVGDRRERRAGRDADGAEARRQPRDAVAMAHPYRSLLADLEHALEQRRLVDDLQFGAAELARVPAFDLAAQRRHHGLLAVADAEHRHAGIEHRLRRSRRARLMHAGRAAGQDDGARRACGKRRFRLVVRHDLRIDARLAHAPRDQLRHLAAEIDDQHPVVLGLGPHHFDGDALARAPARGAGSAGASASACVSSRASIWRFARHGRWL